MGGQAPRRIKATNPEQIECFENMAAAAKANDVANLQTSIQQLEALVPSQQREGKQFHELNQALKIAIREGHLEAAGALLNVQGIRANDFFTEILASDRAVDFFELLLLDVVFFELVDVVVFFELVEDVVFFVLDVVVLAAAASCVLGVAIDVLLDVVFVVLEDVFLVDDDLM